MSEASKKMGDALELLHPETWGWFGIVSHEEHSWSIGFFDNIAQDQPAPHHTLVVTEDLVANSTPTELKNSFWKIMRDHGWQLPGTVDPPDMVNHPPHYKIGGVEVIELTEQMNFCRGNAIKYIARAGLKDPDKELEDLQKAAWYLQREIDRMIK
jgi:hypothetical protein